MSKSRSPGSRRLVIALAGLLTAGAVAAATVATTNANDIVSGVDHFVTCFDFMINDQASHQRNCQPNRVSVEFKSLSTPVTGPAAVVTPSSYTPPS